jgi:Uma2 family endonuclease
VVFGVSNRKRRSYKTWQEGGKLPSFILEITSLSTKKQDEESKPLLYASLGVPEYFQYDPTGDNSRFFLGMNIV